MTRKLLCAFLSALMILSCFGTMVYAEDEAELAAWTGTVMAVKGNAFAYETKNYKNSYNAWDEDTGYYYMHYDSVIRSSSENISAGTGSNVLYIGRWGMTNTVSESDRKAYVAMIVRTNSASTPAYKPMGIVPDTVVINDETAGKTAFAASGEWEFNSIDLVFPSDVDAFTHGQLRFGTEDGKYLELAAWGIFPATVAKTDAEATLRNAAVCADADVHVVQIADTEGNIETVHTLLKGKKVTLPDFEDTAESSFYGWTDTKGSYTVVAKGGVEYTPTDDVTLYPVWVDFVRFVDESAATNGNGLTASTPYNSFASAASDLAESGGTIVVVGTTTFTTLANSGDIVITSVYDGVDYRGEVTSEGLAGTYLNVGTFRATWVENPGKVTFTDIDTVAASWANWHVNGHPFELTDTVGIYKASTSNSTSFIQLMLTGSGDSSIPSSLALDDITLSFAQTGPYVFLGARKNLTLTGADIVFNNKCDEVYITNNIGNVAYPDHGQLTVDGDIKFTINGTVKSINTREYSADYNDGVTYPGLASFKGDLSVIIANGGKLTNGIYDGAKPTEGNWYIVRAVDGVTLDHGEDGNDFVLTLVDGLDYNFANLTNTTTGETSAHFIEDNTASFTLTESGDYTMTLSKNESKTITFVDKNGEREADPINTIAGLSVTLPTLENTDTLVFEGWTSDENGTEVEYEGGEKYTVSDDITFYAVWSDAETYTVTFMADGEEFDTFVGIEGKTVKYPTAYPEKDGYYFKKWDKIIDKIGSEDVTVTAEFVSREEVGYVY